MTAPFRRLLVANRGEIAIRIFRTCAELGIESVAVYSDADADALHLQWADRAERIGPPSAADSYLSVESVLAAAERSAADALHPGYGFLSEDPRFARAVEAAGIRFVGPPAATLEGLGNKLAARRAAGGAGVPVVPGLLAPLEESAADSVARVGFPLLLKAAGGGGGRGMRRVDEPSELPAALRDARREASAAFGDPTVYAERIVAPARHVEVQLIGDRHGEIACLGERECSVQRRHQKLLEESPSPAVTPELRAALFESARRVAGAVEFHNAATVEFLVDANGGHYFLEMNPRLQVEHGVTELVTGLDLVALQIGVAAGDRLPREVVEAEPRGHAVEVRLYAEDPHRDFGPAPGAVRVWRMPLGPGVRVDAGVEAGSTIPAEYDPLLAKLLVHGSDRAMALARLRRVLAETLIGGVQTDLSFYTWLLDDEAFLSGDYDTELIPRRWGSGPELSRSDAQLVALAAARARQSLRDLPAAASSGDAVDAAAAAHGVSAWQRTARLEAVNRG